MQECEKMQKCETMQECETKIEKNLEKSLEKNCNCHQGDIVYILGIIGAATFYFSHATSFWIGVLGFLKALVWPAFIVYELLTFLMK